MKCILSLIAIPTVALVLGATSPAPAQDWQDSFYAKFDVGGNWVKDTSVREVLGYAVPGDKVKFDPGFRAGVALGYDWANWFATEAEFGLGANEIKEWTGATRVDAWLWNTPLLLNAKFQIPNRSIFTPYFGAGVGGASTGLDVDHLDYGNAHFWGSASDIVFAYQAFAGVRVELKKRLSLGVEYRYVHSDAPNFDIDWGYYWNGGNDHIRIGALDTQSISLLLHYEF
jgi:opacity protein-like surface antigen